MSGIKSDTLTDTQYDQIQRMVQSLSDTHPCATAAFKQNKTMLVPALIVMYNLFNCNHDIPSFVPEYNCNNFSNGIDTDEMTKYLDGIEFAQCTHLD